MDDARLRTPYVLLTKLFLRQFLENDLISPEADRTQLLAVVGALSMSLTLFISAIMSASYLSPLTTPGGAAVQSLDDKFFYLSLAMVVTALVAASQWDVLAIDPRDAAILEPLPVPAGTIRRAKVSAIAILGGAVACALNVFPSLVFPWMLVFTFRQMSGFALLGLVVVHALVTVAAAAFGYLVVIALRETLVALLGRRGFTVASPWAQGALIVLLGSAVLLIPVAADRIGQRGFEGWRAMSPPMWFLGAYEVAVGGVIADLPRDRDAAAPGGERRHRQRAVSAAAPGSFRRWRVARPWPIGVTFLVAAAAYLWNARRVAALAPVTAAGVAARMALGRTRGRRVAGSRSGGTGGFLFHAGGHVPQQQPSPDAGVRRGGRICDGARGALQRERAGGRGPVGAVAGDAAAAVWRIARRVPARDPRAGGAACQLGLSAGVARTDACVRRRREARRHHRPGLAGAGDPAAVLHVRDGTARWRCCTPAWAWPARSCCSRRCC